MRILAPLAAVPLALGLAAAAAAADPPELSSWLLNLDGRTGYGGLPADVQQVAYSDSNVYVSCSCIPAYPIGPWPGNPNTPTDQGFRFRIPRQPRVQDGPRTATPLGQIGVWRNGVVVFNARDGRSYNNLNIWHQNAVVAEAASMDSCLGHPTMTGVYHHHQNPRCLYSADPASHSPILGYAFDGFPIYGPYAWSNPDGTGGARRMRTSYRLRNITQRTTLPDGTVLPPAQYGPPVSPQYPLGYYLEDFEYVAGFGDLDASNGRVAVTPDYPGGTYAYHVTIDDGGASAYPYVLGPDYHGILAAGNTGPGGGHVVPAESVTVYVPTTGIGHPAAPPRLALGAASPNPFSSRTVISYALAARARVTIRLYDAGGRAVADVLAADQDPGPHEVAIDASRLPAGVYCCRVAAGGLMGERSLVVLR